MVSAKVCVPVVVLGGASSLFLWRLVRRICRGRASRPSAGPTEQPRPRTKKGACFASKHPGWEHRIASLRPSWFYNWSHKHPATAPAGIEYVPMVFGARNPEMTKEKLEHVKSMYKQGKISAVLGFNEPDGKDQANMSVDQALQAWPDLQLDGLALGSPAAVKPFKPWMKEFHCGCTEKGYRMDFIAIHWYGGPDADRFIKLLHTVYEEYKRPIWITEFAVADWSAKDKQSNRFTEAQVKNFMRKVLPELDRLEFVHRYSWFGFRQSSRVGHPSALFNDADNSLTALGEIYANHTPYDP